jgi:hypothetical protein
VIPIKKLKQMQMANSCSAKNFVWLQSVSDHLHVGLSGHQTEGLLFIGSEECDRIPCEADILLQTQPECQRQRSKNELVSATVHRVCV